MKCSILRLSFQTRVTDHISIFIGELDGGARKVFDELARLSLYLLDNQIFLHRPSALIVRLTQGNNYPRFAFSLGGKLHEEK